MKMTFVAFILSVSSYAFAAQNFVFCMEGSPSSFNPQIVTDGVSMNSSAQTIFNRLVEFKYGSTEVGPGLAESWTVSPDKKSFTFKLAKNVQFHSNANFKPTRPFNADDVVYTFKSQLDKKHPLTIPAANYEYFNAMDLGQIIADVVKVDDYTVTFKLNRPEAPFLADLAMDFASILSKEYSEYLIKSGKGLKALETAPIGTGPFIFKSYQKDSAVRYTANPQYFRGKPKIENLVYVIVTDPTVRLQKMKSGECHVMTQPQPQDLPQIAKLPNAKIVSIEGLNVAYVAFNAEKRPFNDTKVRQALSMAMNQKSYIDLIYQSQGTPAKNPIPPSMWSYNDATKAHVYDVAKAKDLLTKAGYANGFETELWYMPVTRPYLPGGKKLGELIQADLAKIGVKVKLVTYDWPVYLEKSRKGEHQMIQMGWTGDNGDPDNFMNILLSCSSIKTGSNLARWCDKDFDALIQKAKEDSNTKARTDYYKKAQVIFNEKKPWFAVAHAKSNVVISNKVVGYKIDPFGHENFQSVDLK